MEILMAKEMGFCFGVRRAVELAQAAAHEDIPVWTLGPLVHNNQVVERLRQQGIGSVSSLDEVPCGTVVIPSHGLPLAVSDIAHIRGLRVVDATCPMVRSSQKQAKNLGAEGFQVIVFGDESHAEVKGICGWAGGKAIVVTGNISKDDVPPTKKLALIAQSTQSASNFLEISKQLLAKNLGDAEEIRIYNTICDATAKRQDAAAQLARQVKTIIVVGGRDSANTRRLAEVCVAAGAKAHLIETAPDIEAAWINGQQSIGVTAGASTPDWVVKEVVEHLQRM
jgi:(E)-4-hydroxy-3-methyl-but-2-enyl pyrophosphate reductase